MIGLVVRIFGTDILEMYWGRPRDDGTKPPSDGKPPLTAQTDLSFGFGD